jgi:glutathione S-transferase
MLLYAIPFSTNVERVALALGHKGLAAERAEVDPADRTPVRAVSGQDLVPVLVDDGAVVADSSTIVAHLERRFPERPLFPAQPARRAEMELFVEWFDEVWKGPPNAIAAELERPQPDAGRVSDLGHRLERWLDRFEAMLDGRAYLMGDELSAADCAAFPFLRYALGRPAGDDELFHRVLERHQRLGPSHPRLREWIHRVDGHPRG